MAGKEEDFYQKLRAKMKKWLATKEGSTHEWAEFLMLAPDFFHLLWKLSADDEVPPSERAKLVLVIAYFISPIDLLPEAILGPIGFADDIALAAYVLNGLVNKTGPEIVAKHWAGEDDVLIVIRKVLAIADKMVGSGLMNRLKKRIPGM